MWLRKSRDWKIFGEQLPVKRDDWKCICDCDTSWLGQKMMEAYLSTRRQWKTAMNDVFATTLYWRGDGRCSLQSLDKKINSQSFLGHVVTNREIVILILCGDQEVRKGGNEKDLAVTWKRRWRKFSLHTALVSMIEIQWFSACLSHTFAGEVVNPTFTKSVSILTLEIMSTCWLWHCF
jgi:hypothetical protein